MTAQQPEPVSEPAWQQFEQQLRGYVGRRVDPGAADDLVGDILLRLVRSRDALAAARNPAAWVNKVAANAIVDHRRRHAREKQALDAFPEPQELEADTETTEFASCMLPMIRGLPDTYAEALLLTEIGGLSQTEAAKRLGLSASGMKSRVQRARQKLKASLLRCCEFEFDRRGGLIDYRPKNTSVMPSGASASRCAPADCNSSCVP